MLGLGNSLLGGAALSELLPTDISNLSIYLKNGTGVTAAQWDDSSGNGNNARQTTSGDQAAVEDGGLNFTSSEGDHYDFKNQVEISAEEGFSIFVVVNLTTQNSHMTVLGLNHTNHFFEFTNPSGTDQADKLRIRLGTGTTIINPDGDDQFASGEKFLLSLVREAGGTGNLVVYKNGSLLTQSSQAANPNDGEFVSLGVRSGDRFLNGIIYELLFYEQAVSGSELTDLHAHLTAKHGL